jgi:hypothetical protein
VTLNGNTGAFAREGVMAGFGGFSEPGNLPLDFYLKIIVVSPSQLFFLSGSDLL